MLWHNSRSVGTCIHIYLGYVRIIIKIKLFSKLSTEKEKYNSTKNMV